MKNNGLWKLIKNLRFNTQSFINLWLYFWHIRVFNFMFVGGLSFILGLIIYYPLTLIIQDKIVILNQVFYLPAILISNPIVAVFSWWANKKWTYKGIKTKSVSLGRYEVMGMTTIFLDMAVLFLIVHYGHIYYLLAMVCTAFCMFLLRYTIASNWIWRINA